MHDAVLLAMFLWQIQAPGAVNVQPQQAVLSPGALTVTAAPAQQITAGRGSQRVPMLSLSFSAECAKGPISIEEIRLLRTGPGSSDDLAAVYLDEDGIRMSTAHSVPREGAFTLRLRGFHIEPCDTRTLTVLADIAADADIAGVHGLQLQSQDPFLANARSVRISVAPGFAPMLRTAPQASGRIEVSFLPLIHRISYGDNRTVARLRLTASERDQTISAVTLTNLGTASNGDLQALRLTTAQGKDLTMSASMNGKRVRLTFDPPFVLNKGRTVLLHLRANVRSGASRSVQFTLEEPSDLAATPSRSVRNAD